MVRNILYNSLVTGRTQVINLDEDTTITDVYKRIEEKEGIPCHLLNLSLNGKTILEKQDFPVDDGHDIILHLHFSMEGGKGGFGSMLRAIGAQIEKTTNKHACRDLSGRRLRDVNAEKKLKEWVSKAAKRKEEEKQRKKARLLKMQKEPKIEFEDQDYFKTRSEIPETIDDAVEKGMKKALKAYKNGSHASCTATRPTSTASKSESEPSTSKVDPLPSSSSNVPVKRKDAPSTSSASSVKKKKSMLWVGVDLDDEDLSDDD